MKNSNYVELYFGISEFEDNNHDKISKILNIQPTRVYYKGQKTNPNFLIKADYNAWFLHHSLVIQDSSFDEQLNALLDILEPRIDALSKLSKKYYCEFSCAVFVHNKKESSPWIHLGERFNKFVRKVNVEIDFDIYN